MFYYIKGETDSTAGKPGLGASRESEPCEWTHRFPASTGLLTGIVASLLCHNL